MRSILIICLVAVITTQSYGQFTKATLQATGLTCAMCSNAINKALKAKPFIQSVISDIKNSSFDIVFKENVDVNIDEIRKAVEDAGFSIGNLKLTGNFREVKVGDNEHVQIGNKNFHFIKVSSQVLNGEQTITMIEKDFLTAKQFKKFSGSAKIKGLETGKAESCCPGLAPGSRVYHVTI
ncbi:MAG TPA: heavy metal-associated domain-containing protein [Chitinophagaceae bacterium]|nr:heavy metal-associated domain-containing protein [Chitinophagaceae bacterium]